jgi:riboflavin synthase
MFTGIVQSVGTVVEVHKLSDNSIQLEVNCNDLNSNSKIGDSIAIAGICLTVEKVNQDSLTFTAISETLDKTKISEIVKGSSVNIEQSAKLQDLVGGHQVSGHIDTTGKVVKIAKSDNWSVLRFAIDEKFANLVVSKGSISIDGVSLTISNIMNKDGENWVEVSLIPITMAHTTLGSLVEGNLVNIEFDLVAKYVAQNSKK